MATDYKLICYTCHQQAPDCFASGSGFYGFKVWDHTDANRKWLGHGEAVGSHEGHDLRIVREQTVLPWNDEDGDPAEA